MMRHIAFHDVDFTLVDDYGVHNHALMKMQARRQAGALKESSVLLTSRGVDTTCRRWFVGLGMSGGNSDEASLRAFLNEMQSMLTINVIASAQQHGMTVDTVLTCGDQPDNPGGYFKEVLGPFEKALDAHINSLLSLNDAALWVQLDKITDCGKVDKMLKLLGLGPKFSAPENDNPATKAEQASTYLQQLNDKANKANEVNEVNVIETKAVYYDDAKSNSCLESFISRQNGEKEYNPPNFQGELNTSFVCMEVQFSSKKNIQELCL